VPELLDGGATRAALGRDHANDRKDDGARVGGFQRNEGGTRCAAVQQLGQPSSLRSFTGSRLGVALVAPPLTNAGIVILSS